MNKKLGLLDCIMLIMGSMIGSGIFIVPAAMSRDLQSPAILLLAWVVTAFITVIAALNYGELSAMIPKAGGQYVYLQRAYNNLFGFLYGWTLFAVIQTGTIAAVAVAFAKFTGVFLPIISDKVVLLDLGMIQIQSQQALAMLVIWILTIFNFLPVKNGAILQNTFTFTKIGAIVFLLLAGLYHLYGKGMQPISYALPSGNISYWGLFCAALVGSIFSADAWNNITFTGGEIAQPQRNLPLSLLIGTLSVTALYVFINWIYIGVLPFDAIEHAPSDRVGTLLLQTVMGDIGMYVMAAFIMISTFGCINGITLSGARVYYAMALDGLFFKRAATKNINDSPQAALVMQAIWTSILTLSGSYSDLLDYVVFAVLLFYILTVAGIFILRKKEPHTIRPYKVWGYPYLPALYIMLAMFVCLSLLIFKPLYTYPGLAIVLAGIPIYYLIRKK